MVKKCMAVRPYIVGSGGLHQTLYQTDLKTFEDRAAAISHGFDTLKAEDDFLIVTLNSMGEIESVGWMMEDREEEDPGELAAIGQQLGLEVADA